VPGQLHAPPRRMQLRRRFRRRFFRGLFGLHLFNLNSGEGCPKPAASFQAGARPARGTMAGAPLSADLRLSVTILATARDSAGTDAIEEPSQWLGSLPRQR
jgi:hypothetical protein